MNAKQICGAIVALCVATLAARADSLELKIRCASESNRSERNACRGREGSGHRGRNRCGRGSRLGNYHQGRPSEDPERDLTGFHSATERDDSETRSLIALPQK